MVAYTVGLFSRELEIAQRPGVHSHNQHNGSVHSWELSKGLGVHAHSQCNDCVHNWALNEGLGVHSYSQRNDCLHNRQAKEACQLQCEPLGWESRAGTHLFCLFVEARELHINGGLQGFICVLAPCSTSTTETAGRQRGRCVVLTQGNNMLATGMFARDSSHVCSREAEEKVRRVHS
eukprot:scaffold153558_cov21-Tisochrysis_lutea.AAC.1